MLYFKIMKKIGYISIGLIVSVLLSYLAVVLIINPIMKETGQSPESLMGHVYLIVYPICLLLGSTLSGYLLSPIITKNIKEYFKYLPGLYASIPYLIGILSTPVLALLFALAALANIIMSAIGMYVGMKLRGNLTSSLLE